MRSLFRALVIVFSLPFLALTTCDNSIQNGLDVATERAMPNVVGAKSLSQHYVEVTFATAPGLEALQAGRYEILDAEQIKLAIRDAFVGEDSRQVVLTTDLQNPKEYFLRVSGADIEPSLITLGPAPISGAGGDQLTFLAATISEPDLRSAISLSNTSVLLLYSLKMDRPTTLNRPFYSIANPDLNIITTMLSVDDVSLSLTTSPQEDDTYTVTVTNVRSSIPLYAGGYINPDRNTATFQGIAPVDTVRPRLVLAEAMADYSTVVLSFSEPLENHAEDVANYMVTPSLTVIGVELNEWRTQAIVHLLPMTAGVSYTMAVNNVEDRSGNVIDQLAKTAMFGIPADEAVMPRLVSAVSIDSSTVLLTYSEPMMDNAGDPSKYMIAPGLVVIGAALSEFKTQVTLTTLAQTAGTEYMVTVSNVSDSVGNVIDPNFDMAMFTFAGANANDPAFAKLPPRVVGAIATSDTTVVVTFNKPMDDNADVAANYAITGPETVFLFVTEALRSQDGTQVRLVTSPQADYDYTVHVVGVKDTFGNSIAAPDGIFTSPTGYDPSRAVFRGVPPDSIDRQIDTDGDEFADWFETAGWDIIIGLANGGTKRAFVTSDPYNPDTDGDGFDDGDENAHSWDPRTDDTDADQLTDGDEFNLWYSDPADQDTDNDGIDDLTEVTFFRTNPGLADTDGDGFDDGRELFEVNRNPRVADLPIPRITTGDIRLQIDERYTFVDSTGESRSEESSSSVNLQQSERSAQNTTDTSSTQTTFEAGVEAELGFEGGFAATGNGGARGFVALVRPSFKWSQGSEDTTTTSTESSTESQQVYETSLTKGREFTTSQEVTREVVGARIDTSLTLVNGSDVAFTISNMQLSVLQPGIDRTRFVPVATMVPSSQLITGNDLSINIGPLDPERGPIIFTSTDVFPNLVEDLMRAPRGLIVKLTNFDVIDEFGRNLAFIGQEVNDKTANITVDYGDGTVDRYQVAVNGGLDINYILGGRCAHNPLLTCHEDSDCDTTGTCVAGHCTNSPETECTVNANCNLAGACDAQPLGGFDDFGVTRGIPLDFALQDILGFVKNPTVPNVIVAGLDGVATTFAEGDDSQVVPVGTTGLSDRTVVVFAGANGVLDTTPNNGIPTGDDVTANTNGYETSRTCNAPTDGKIIEPKIGGDGFASTMASLDDVQMIAVGAAAAAEAIIILPGPNGRIDSVQNGDDELRGPGDICSVDADCTGGACTGREVLRRFKNSPTGDPNRFWFAISTDAIPVGSNLGMHILRPGESLTLSFGKDIDRDGLFATEEFLFGSNDQLKDTDADHLGDFTEIRVGWGVEVVGQTRYTAYPDPRLKDSDADGVRDEVEMRCETDPRRRDSDGDGLTDGEELNCGVCCRDTATGVDCLNEPVTVGVCCTNLSGTSCDFRETCTTDTNCAEDGDMFAVCFQDLRRQYCSTTDDCLAIGVCCTNSSGTSCEKTELCDVDGDCRGDNDSFTTCVKNLYDLCSIPCSDICPPPAAFPFPPTRLDPRNRDTDNDSVFDAREIEIGSNPLNPNDAADFRDSDEDGITDRQEADGWDIVVTLCSNSLAGAFNNVCNDSGNPVSADYGKDCADCGHRTLAPRHVVSSPSDPDTDFDGLPDFVERAIATDPDEVDTDKDGISDYDEFDRFGEFLRFNFEFAGFFLSDSASQKLGTNPLSQDTDGDELSDDFEQFAGWRVLDAEHGTVRDVFSSALFPDSDLDGASDQKELRGGDTSPINDGNATDPADPDTDGDQRLDGVEFGRSDPLKPDVYVTVNLRQFRDIAGPNDDNSGVSDEWIFAIFVRRPNQNIKSLLLNHVQLVQRLPALGTLISDACLLPPEYGDMYWRETTGDYDITLISNSELNPPITISFDLPQGDAVVVEGDWSEYDSCLNGNTSVSCTMTFQETFSGAQLVPGAFITKAIEASDLTGDECTATIDIEVIVE
ncbi:MAG: hypothetical protein AABZ47_08510 [Planctomycetota bacterium]